uniref:Putative site-specific DNA endonuclease n=1 Tax=Pleodorina starrii TaxID=330485 RepID=M9P839_9CHLO|nr:putative site-specific DNA endonuclease [Pleodorina starrii]AFY64390.1 putative site-specific DNA endonuclease [Pleodorina starrii]
MNQTNNASKRKRGPDHGNYKHGLGKSRDYDPLEYSKWKQAILMKYGYCCILTGQTTDLECHHLFSWYEAPALQYDVNNGVVLAKEVHHLCHKIYGHGQNTRAQFEEFCKNFYPNVTLPTQYGYLEPIVSKDLKDIVIAQAKRKKKELLELLKQRNHKLVTGNSFNSQDKIIVRCLSHGETFETTVTNYKRCKTGLHCCGKQSVIDFTSKRERKSDGTFK